MVFILIEGIAGCNGSNKENSDSASSEKDNNKTIISNVVKCK
jgi:hypothetical protein